MSDTTRQLRALRSMLTDKSPGLCDVPNETILWLIAALEAAQARIVELEGYVIDARVERDKAWLERDALRQQLAEAQGRIAQLEAHLACWSADEEVRALRQQLVDLQAAGLAQAKQLAEAQHELSASEALFGFAGWLTSRRETSGPFSAVEPATQAADLVTSFCQANHLPDPRPGWHKRLVHPKDGD